MCRSKRLDGAPVAMTPSTSPGLPGMPARLRATPFALPVLWNHPSLAVTTSGQGRRTCVEQRRASLEQVSKTANQRAIAAPIIIFHRRMAPGPTEVAGLKCFTPSLAAVAHQASTRVVHDARAASKRPAHINSRYGLMSLSTLATAMPIGRAWEGSGTYGQRILKK